MGTQGEIHNVLGITVPAKLVEKDKLYRVNGKTVATHEDYEESADFSDGSWLGEANLERPELKVRILGHTHGMGSRHFGENLGDETGQALVGYVVANESYYAHATKLPLNDQIDTLRPRLVEAIKERLGLQIKPSDLELYLVYDWDQSDQK